MSGNRIADEADISRAVSSCGHADGLPYVHKVGVPPKQNLLNEFKFTFKETFFHDDPLRAFKDQARARKLLLGIRAIFPILDWGRRYDLSMFRADLIAGITTASLCIPQDIAYAKLANLDPQYGLYSSFVPPLIYAFMGSLRYIAIGPVAVVSLLLGTMLQKEFDPEVQKVEYQRLAFTATFFAGTTQFALGCFRFGFLIDLLSHAGVVGFKAGAAITITLQQLEGLLGMQTFTKKSGVIPVMKFVWTNVHHGWNWETIIIGVTFLVFLLLAKYLGKKNKKLFMIAAISPLISVVVSTFFVYITRAEKKGVQIVNHITKGINPSSVHQIYFTGSHVFTGFRIGAVAGMVALAEAVAIGRSFGAKKDHHIDGNREMVALGCTNIIGSMTSSFITTGSFSRSAINYMTGCKTAMSNIIIACVMCLTLLVLTPLFKYTPNAILASITISAVLGLVDYDAMILIWKTDKFDFIACTGAFLGVIFYSVEIGLLVAVCISFVKIFLHVTRPRIAVLGKIPRTTVYSNIQQYPEATKVPGVLIVRVDSAIYFSNSNYIKERILRLLADEGEPVQEKYQQRIQYLIMEMSPVVDIDTSGIHSMEDLFNSLQQSGIHLVLANPGQSVLAKLHASGLAKTVGDENVFLTVEDAVMTLAPKMEPNIHK
ncbi:sulfate transporter 1.3-like [Henckelia pumila]|uniref:sulfate transporter 1.3-like n=1 Tax=Henckelia pumila TaxID=405737 RepID=UPI003C6E1813